MNLLTILSTLLESLTLYRPDGAEQINQWYVLRTSCGAAPIDKPNWFSAIAQVPLGTSIAVQVGLH
ncbi:hypothetical protein [Parathermosynechococcus lividus]